MGDVDSLVALYLRQGARREERPREGRRQGRRWVMAGRGWDRRGCEDNDA